MLQPSPGSSRVVVLPLADVALAQPATSPLSLASPLFWTVAVSSTAFDFLGSGVREIHWS